MTVHSRSHEPPQGGHSHHGHAHFWDRAMARGQFLTAAAGAAGAALSAPLWLPGAGQVAAASGVLPKPIPGGLYFLGPGTELFHVFGPQPGDECSTITDFEGVIGAAHLQGPTIRTLSDGSTTTQYCDYDMRFMKGRYIGVDGRPHTGTLSFFWFDIYELPGAAGTQYTSIDPGNVPNGLFWTVLVPDSAVQVNLAAGSAVMAVTDLPTWDFITFTNDILHGPAIPTTVSFTMQWSGLANRSRVRLPVLQDGSPGFVAQLAQSETSGATVQFTANEPTAVVNGVTGASYSSDPLTPATVLYAALGLERNGVFFNG